MLAIWQAGDATTGQITQQKKEMKNKTNKKRSLVGGRRGTGVRRILVSVLCIGLELAVMVGIAVPLVGASIARAERDRVITREEAVDIGGFDCILVLGAGVRSDGSPSDMLSDRMDTGIDLYLGGASDRLLMSGDHGRSDYDEVNAMKQGAVNAGIDPDAVFCDHAGFSTYDSIYRARDIFSAKRVLIVSQEYHLYRALYIAKKLGLEAYGVSADLRSYRGQSYRDLRECAARFKDFFMAQIKPEPTYLGDRIPLDGPGSATDG